MYNFADRDLCCYFLLSLSSWNGFSVARSSVTRFGEILPVERAKFRTYFGYLLLYIGEFFNVVNDQILNKVYRYLITLAASLLTKEAEQYLS